MSKHTPGPWVNDGGLVNGRESRERFAPGTSVDIFDAVEWPAEMEVEAHANARLIAAAPDLLDALGAVVVALDGRVHSHPALAALEQARAAIAKATGQ